MNLTDRDKEQIKGMIDRGEPLPAKYKLMLFADAPEVELVWQGKSSEVTSAVLPFQSIEQIDEPRKKENEQVAGLFEADARGRQSSGWTNKLIWGNNNLVLSSLKNGPLRREIDAAGGLKLIYIDPPFDVGADFSVDIEVGDETLTKEPSVIEELAYRDTWGRGSDSYLAMLYERLKIMHDLLATDGAIYVHIAHHVGHLVRVLLDEIFGRDNFRNEIVWWYYNKMQGNVNHFPRNHDLILYYAKSKSFRFERLSEPREKPTRQQRRVWDGESATLKQARDEAGNLEYYTVTDRFLDDVWKLHYLMPADQKENLRYATQKPESVIDRVIRASTIEGDLVADFFSGSGTTLAVAEKLGRKWIGCDMGRFAIHTTRKRLIGVQRELKAEGKPYRSFEILNLGKYERQYFLNQMSLDAGAPRERERERERVQLACQKEEQYLHLILTAYKAERVLQMPPFHGRKGSNVVVVGPIDAPVTLALVNEVLGECRKSKISKADILGFEFEMGLTPAVQDEAKAKGITLSLKYIPKDVFDKRAVERGQVQFYDVAYVEVLPKVEKMKATVTLKDFGVFYRQDDLSALGEKLKPGGSKVTVEGGQVVKISKDKAGKVVRELLTKKWSDWIDYWAVDFHFEDKKEIIRLVEDGQEREAWTGNYIFENEWQSFRTRRDRTLELTSAPHEYEKKGKYKIAVKVIDIFGNDTTKVVEVKI